MNDNILIKYIEYPEGRVACKQGFICRIHGMILYISLVNNDEDRPDIEVIRVPLMGEGLIPLESIEGAEDGFMELVMTQDKESITPDTIFHMLRAQIHYGTLEDIPTTLQQLKNCGAVYHHPLNYEFLELEVYDKGQHVSYGDILFQFPRKTLIRDLAFLQDFIGHDLVFAVYQQDDKNNHAAAELTEYMKRIWIKGLYSGWKGKTEVYFDGKYLIGEDYLNPTATTLHEFKNAYNNVYRLIQGH